MICKNVNIYCKEPELIENYDKAISDKDEMWICHHKLEQVFTLAELKRAGWYFDRKPQEFIFIRRSEHDGNTKIHISHKNQKRGYAKSPEQKSKRCSDAHKGIAFSDERKKHMSESMKGSHKCKHWKLIDGRRVWYE